MTVLYCAACGCPLQPLNPQSNYNLQSAAPAAPGDWWGASQAAHHAIVHDDMEQPPLLLSRKPKGTP